MTVDELRKKYPEYGDISDEELLERFRTKFYPDLPKESFYAKLIKKNKEPPTKLEYYLDRAKKGIRQAGEQFASAGDPLRKAMEERGIAPNVSKAGKPLTEALNIQDTPAPADGYSKYVGEGIQQMADPTNWVSGIGGKTGGVITNALSSFLPGATGEFAGDVAVNSGMVEKGGWGDTAARLLGGVAGGLGNASVSRVGRTGKALLDAQGGSLVENANKKVFSQAEQHIQNTIKAAVDADPSLVQVIAQIRQKAEKEGIPITLAMFADNAVIRSEINKLASRDSRFAALFGRDFEAATEALKKTTDTTFGSPVQAKQTLQDNLGETRYERTKKIQDNLDFRIKEASNPTGPQQTKPLAPYYAADNLSQQNSIRMKTPEGQISPKSLPLYSKADDIANQTGAHLSEDSTRNIYQLVVGDMKESPYSRFPALFDRVKKVAAPVVDPGNPRIKQWNPTPYKEVRDLQSTISAEYAALNPNSPTYRADRAELSKLRGAVDESIKKEFPVDLVDVLKQAGRQYAYDFNVREFGRAAFNDKGIIDPTKVNNWLKDENNVRAMQSIVDPTTGKTLGEIADTPTKMVARLLERKDYVNSLYTEFNKARITDFASKTPQQIVNELYNDNKSVERFLKEFGKNESTLNALRSFMLDDIVNSPTPLKTLLKDKNKASTYNRLFGPGYAEKVQNIAELSERLKKSPADVKFDTERGINKDWLEEKFNVPGSMIFSKLRNPIMSKRQALVELGSKAMTGAVNNEYERRMKSMLLDPKTFSEYASLVSKIADNAPISDAGVSAFLKKVMFDETMTTGAKAAMGGRVGAETQNE